MPGRIDLLRALLPITTKKFWFVNSYLAVYLISPFLNKLIHGISKKQLEYLIILLFVMFPLRLTFLPLTWSQDGSGGMSVTLFIVLYCMAAWLRLYYSPQDARSLKYLLRYLGTALFLVLSKWVLLKLVPEPYTTKLYGYISIFTIFASVSLFLFFLYSRPITGWIEKPILKVAPHSFAVYIIHFCMMKALFCDVFHLNKLVGSVAIGLPATIVSCVAIFAACVLVDMGRVELVGRAGELMRRRGCLKKYDSILENWNRAAHV